MATDEMLRKLAVYLRAHEELALRWQQVHRDDETGYWEIVYVTDCIQFQGNAMSSTSLETLANKLPKV